MVVGRVCPQSGEWWVEHWAPKKRKASFEKIPQPPSPKLALTLVAPGRAVITELGTRWAIARNADGSWVKLEPPGDKGVDQVAASPAGRLWMLVGGRVFSKSGDAAFAELALPEGKRATRVYPSDQDEPFVLAGSELLGPASAFDGEIVSVQGGATSLCTEPYVIVEAKVKRTKKYPEAIEKVKRSGVPIVALVFGHRGMAGEDSIQAKVKDMKAARDLAKAFGGAAIACGVPNTEAKLPDAG